MLIALPWLNAQIAGITAPALSLIAADDPARPGAEDLQKLHPETRVVVIAHSE